MSRKIGTRDIWEIHAAYSGRMVSRKKLPYVGPIGTVVVGGTFGHMRGDMRVARLSKKIPYGRFGWEIGLALPRSGR